MVNKKFLYIIATILIIIIIFFIFNKTNNKEEEIIDLDQRISPVELAKNKEKYEGQTISIINAYVPSEAFIYINEEGTEERIFLEPPNKIYCRYFDLTGKLEKDSEINRWTFLVEESKCLKKA